MIHRDICATCLHFTVTTDDERRGETLPGEHPDARSLGYCAEHDDDAAYGAETCGEYAKREDAR